MQLLNHDLKQSIKKIGGMYLNKANQLLGNDDYIKFIIVSHSRSGSNLMINSLKQYPGIYIPTRSEIFAAHNRIKGENFVPILNQLFTKRLKNIKAVGCKIFYYHLTDEEWKKIVNIPNLKIIHLQRKNRLRIIVSEKIAFKTGQWASHNKSDTVEINSKKIHLDFDEVLQRIETIESWEKIAKERFKNHSYQDVYYEDLTNQLDPTITNLTAFLGFSKKVNIKTKLYKQNPEPLCELIENYQELKTQFQDTRWEHYFE